MHGDDIVVFCHSPTADTTQLLHMAADANEQAEVHAQGTNIGAGFAAHPERSEVALIVEFQELGLVDGADAQLSLDG